MLEAQPKKKFLPIELEATSYEITTFDMYRGLYRYNKLISCSCSCIALALEKYQNIVKDSLNGSGGVTSITDDLFVHGKGVKDDHLYAILNRTHECGLTLNRKKCQFRQPKLIFFGHNLRRSGMQPSEDNVNL